jgi:hypothetical protein
MESQVDDPEVVGWSGFGYVLPSLNFVAAGRAQRLNRRLDDRDQHGRTGAGTGVRL